LTLLHGFSSKPCSQVYLSLCHASPPERLSHSLAFFFAFLSVRQPPCWRIYSSTLIHVLRSLLLSVLSCSSFLLAVLCPKSCGASFWHLQEKECILSRRAKRELTGLAGENKVSPGKKHNALFFARCEQMELIFCGNEAFR
jgi:hypothetical protein